MVLEKWSLILHSDNLKEAEAFSLKQRLSGCMSKTLAKGQLLLTETIVGIYSTGDWEYIVFLSICLTKERALYNIWAMNLKR